MGHALVLFLLVAELVLLASSQQVHVWLIELLSKAESIIRAKPILGMLIFTLLAAASTMLAFVSSAIIIPVGVYVWGETTSMLLEQDPGENNVEYPQVTKQRCPFAGFSLCDKASVSRELYRLY